MTINFFTEDVDFDLPDLFKIREWLLLISENHTYSIVSLNYIFCTDEYLLAINKAYLDHHYYTDIITFDNSETKWEIEGDVFISVDRVKENALSHQQTFIKEMYRVIVHGLLHLIGFSDKTTEEARIMREKEDACLSLLSK